MSVYLLVNSAGFRTTLLSTDGAGSTASSYDMINLVSGPRSTHWRSVASTGGVRCMLQVPSDLTPTHIVAARADWLLTKQGMRVRPVQKDSGGTTTYISGVDYNPLTSASLIGPYAQDLCFSITPTSFRGFGLEADTVGGTAEAFQLSKFYASVAFDFGSNPTVGAGPSWQPLPKDQTAQIVIPHRGYTPYEVERRIVLTWANVTRAKLDTFKALDELLRWPLFIYDDAGDIFQWKLEHVIVEPWQERIVNADRHDITIPFLRLKHYD